MLYARMIVKILFPQNFMVNQGKHVYFAKTSYKAVKETFQKHLRFRQAQIKNLNFWHV